MDDVIVRKSRIHGKGVFAARDFRKGELVVHWDPIFLAEADSLPKGKRKYVSVLGGKMALISPPARYVNHSCEPNTRTRNFCDVAVRDIKKGEEITADYGKEGALVSFSCRCGSRACRGFVGKKSSGRLR